MPFTYRTIHITRCRVWAAAVLLLLLYYALLPSTNASLRTLQNTFLVWIIPVLVAAVLYFHGLQAGTEYKFLLAFWFWLWLTRVLNGSPTLFHDFRFFLDSSLMLPFFALGPALTKTERARFLNRLCVLFGGLELILGLFALAVFFRGTEGTLPLIGGTIRTVRDAGAVRIVFFDVSPTVSACWFLLALFLMVYQFFHCEKKLWRIPIVLSSSVDLLVIILSSSKTVLLCVALACALLAAMLVQQLLKSKKPVLRVAVMIITAALVLGAVYKGLALGSDAITVFSDKVRFSAEAEEQGTVPKEAVRNYENVTARLMSLSSVRHEGAWTPHVLSTEQNNPVPESSDPSRESFSRIQLWHGAFQTIAANPSILWRGHIQDSVMIAAYPFVTTDGTGPMPWQFYNSPIQVLMTTGLPGLLLALVFLMKVLYRGIRFSLCLEVPMDVRTLVIPLLAMLPYFMLESCLFTTVDLRTLFYFLMCGLAIGFARDFSY